MSAVGVTHVSCDLREIVEEAIDKLVESEAPFEDIPLILPADGSATRSIYRGVSIRERTDKGVRIFDCAYRLK